MKTIQFDRELSEISITEEIDNNVFHYNIGKHVSTIDEYKERVFIRDNITITNLILNENIKIENAIVVFLSDYWLLNTNNTQNNYNMKRITTYKLIINGKNNFSTFRSNINIIIFIISNKIKNYKQLLSNLTMNNILLLSNLDSPIDTSVYLPATKKG